jgi:A/G-specific adenine glycosylase
MANHRRPAARAALLAWFDRHRRDLPWRRTKDPYAIWISEVMLQQTQVARVVEYWTRFLERFPTVEALAEAALDEVLSLWSGLGYYSRARNLHRAAQEIARHHGGRLPDTAEALAELPGFGRYTAGAVASIAFGQPVPVVDGNVARVLSRLHAVEGAPGDRAREAELWRLAGELVEGDRPGDLNQALMELGATVCRPASPTCLVCPLREECRALREGRVAELPPPKARPPRQVLEVASALCERRGRVLLARRPGTGLFGGLWELPTVELDGGRAAEDAVRALFQPAPRQVIPAGAVRRTLTHRQLSIHLFRVELAGRSRLGGGAESRWTRPEDLDGLGVSSATREALELCLAPANRRVT